MQIERKGLLWSLLVGYDLTTLLGAGVAVSAAGAVIGAGAVYLASSAVSAIVSALSSKKGNLERAVSQLNSAADLARDAGNRDLAASIMSVAADVEGEIGRIGQGIDEAASAGGQNSDDSPIEAKAGGAHALYSGR